MLDRDIAQQRKRVESIASGIDFDLKLPSGGVINLAEYARGAYEQYAGSLLPARFDCEHFEQEECRLRA